MTPREVAIASLRQTAAAIGHTPSRAEYDERDVDPPSEAIVGIFGSWDAATEDANLHRVDWPDDEHDREDCTRAIATVSNRLNTDPSELTAAEYLDEKRIDEPTLRTIRDHYDSWSEAIENTTEAK